MKQTAKKLIHKRVVRFMVVGIFNTLLDFLLFNIFLIISGNAESKLVVVICNTISATMVAILSFFLNRRYVFQSEHTPNHYTVYFVAITLGGLYLVQNTLIYVALHAFSGAANSLSLTLSNLGLPFSQRFILVNAAKAIGTLGSMTWNYLWYKHVVFKPLDTAHK
jgi:putative flippase GtrA